MSEPSPKWAFFVDTGGTFTDCLAIDPNGAIHRAKVLSRGSLSARIASIESASCLKLEGFPDWPDDFPVGFKLAANDGESRVLAWNKKDAMLQLEGSFPSGIGAGDAIELLSGEEAPVLGQRLILARAGLSAEAISATVRLATTRCTNALLEGKGTAPVLFVTKGFPHLLEIGDQRRVSLFDLVPRKRPVLHGPVVEVDERLDRDGKVLHAPDPSALKAAARELLEDGHKVAVVSFMHSYLNDEHERAVAGKLLEWGFARVILSSDVRRFRKWLPRCESAVVEAYLSEVLNNYLDAVERGLGEGVELLVSSSSGGLSKRAEYRAIDSLLSGPAGGVVGAAAVARSAGLSKFINLDMGGTSSDVSRCSESFAYQSSHVVGDAKVANVALRIETVAAGGGSICRIENGLLRVGPESAGAHPGPACYGFGGPLCLTDVNLLLGRIDSSRFSTPLVNGAARARLDELVKESGRSEKDLLFGFLALADDAMANAIRKVSVAEGYDPSDHALVCFGGAGGQHACGVAERLGMKRILSPGDAGLLSAYGLSQARLERISERSVLLALDDSRISSIERELIEDALQKVPHPEARVEGKHAFVRLVGQDTPLEVVYDELSELSCLYERNFRKIYGYFPSGRSLELHSLRIRAVEPCGMERSESFDEPAGESKPSPKENFLSREEIPPGVRVSGPRLVIDDFGALWIEGGWRATKGDRGSLLLEMNENEVEKRKEFPKVARRELFANRFFCIAEEMGVRLERTALSVNVRERLDFSCALLDENGYLVANAPHVPVHLGALGVCLRKIMETRGDFRRGDIVVSNHPAFGGSHLPDVTVIAPVFAEGMDRPVAYLANRAHHAEIGGASPGSMPASTCCLAEEGVVISPQLLFEGGESKMDGMEELLRSGEYPSRQVPENLADLSAQVASLRLGMDAMQELLAEYGQEEISLRMAEMSRESADACEEYLRNLGNCRLAADQYLDDGDRLSLEIAVEEGRATFDFSGTSSVRRDGLNATEAIVSSALCYCLRILIGKELPLNEGLLAPVRIEIPSGCLLRPQFSDDPVKCPGVAGGNVEISQRLVDLILSAFGKVACSQGTMNNLTFGNDRFSHYETIGGGSGASLGQEGASAVQVHMTNTAITDPEILEARFPVRLLAFRKRPGSGGEGSWSGGDGAERIYLFEEEVTASILSQRRVSGPGGIAGGLPGLPGEQFLVRRNGEMVMLDSIERFEARPLDRLVVRTPGGGGAGSPHLIA